MIGLTDIQLKIVMNAARLLPVEKRDIFLQRIATMLALRGRGHVNNADVTKVSKLARTGRTRPDYPIKVPENSAANSSAIERRAKHQRK
jgi:Mg-chelatase subunit ChlI